ncbi:MAG TPA: hypothetical protein VFB62_05020, partial [Polyangiaceae bacterium]|nr:hypothetical protein [Polyangiaceae bacterium]
THEAALPKAGRGALLRTLHRADLLRRLEYVELVQKETKHFEQLPAPFKRSPAGTRARRALADLRRVSVHGAAEWARARLVDEIAQLDDLLFASDEALRLSTR